ncbi:histone H4 [Trichoderma harzianum]|uniref:Histone H4 n=1 Tax=Trichoderma harzianum TaxID=5544 RepID=A0A0F9ZDC1_TRIHA|nr:histone H4 [Trichoderma harzianum]
MPPTVPNRGGPASSQGGKRHPTLGGKLPGLGVKRHRKILKDSIHGITKPAIRSFIPSNAEEELYIISARRTYGTNLRVTGRRWPEDSLIGRIESAHHDPG